MIRYVVKYEAVLSDGRPMYIAVGAGATDNKQFAHLYTTEALAEKKAKYYRDRSQWYVNVEVIPVEVVW